MVSLVTHKSICVTVLVTRVATATGQQSFAVNPFKPSDAKWLDQYGPERFGRLIFCYNQKKGKWKG